MQVRQLAGLGPDYHMSHAFTFTGSCTAHLFNPIRPMPHICTCECCQSIKACTALGAWLTSLVFASYHTPNLCHLQHYILCRCPATASAPGLHQASPRCARTAVPQQRQPALLRKARGLRPRARSGRLRQLRCAIRNVRALVFSVGDVCIKRVGPNQGKSPQQG